MVNNNALLVPPPGAGETTVIFGVPAFSKTVLGITTVNCVDELNEVARAAVSNCAIDVDIKFVPTIVIVTSPFPAFIVLGVRVKIVGNGF
jgi:hypothetical protein